MHSPRAHRPRGRLASIVAWWALASSFAPAPAWAQAGDPAKALKSKEVAERLAAIDGLRASQDPQVEKLLIGAVADKDWEVSERAVLALGERGSKACAAALVRLSVDGDIVRLRRAAARSLAKVAPAEGVEGLLKLLSGKVALRACEALVIVGQSEEASSGGDVAAAISKALRSKDIAVRRAAAGGFGLIGQATAQEELPRLIAGEDAELAALVLDGIAAHPRLHLAAGLLGALRVAQMPDVLERRALNAAAASLAAFEVAGKPELALREWEAHVAAGPAASPEAEARHARLCAAVTNACAGNAPLVAAVAVEWRKLLDSPQAKARKAALAHGLRAGLAEFREPVAALAVKDSDATVRALALVEWVRSASAIDADLRNVLLDRLANDSDASVREAAAVALGVPNLEGAALGLTRALTDADAHVAICAAVSLGKTRDPAALAPLVERLAAADWRTRASAAVGLTWIRQKDAFPALIQALGDADPSVRRTAQTFLESHLNAKLGSDRGAWEAWWKEHGARVQIVDPEEARKRRERYGYAPKTAAVFEDLDVVVLESRGDHIERLLDHLKIQHRRTQAAAVAEAALHPGAIYVSNCTGEIEAKDVERLDWYVRAGGYLFGSCWSLTETIERIQPGILRHLETQGEVLDDVVAKPVDSANPYLKDVFGPDVEPIYHLEGAHLIEVLEPELCEVLIDSPQALERWGGGNLAASFRLGHGLVLDSVNHFDLQGLEVAPGVRSAADRVAFAFDRMGMDYETWRRTQGEKWWDNALKASQNVFDFSALQFVTNFVRVKRLSDG